MPTSRTSRYHGLDTFEARGTVTMAQRLAGRPRAPSEGARHTLLRGETLDALAKRYFGREDLWWVIADANPGRFPLDWEPGDVLVIPPLRVATRTPRR